MPLTLNHDTVERWIVRKIGVIGPGIVGMPMAAMLAHARIREGTDTPANVVVVQRNSPTSGWKVAAINEGRSPIGGEEPELDDIVGEAVAAGLLSADHDYSVLTDADVILVAVQTDKDGWEPDYGPLFSAIDGLAEALRERPPGNIPLVIIESTLAPSSMYTLVKDRFAGHGLEEGRDVLLGNSPNRVMPGRLVERVRQSDKLVGGLRPVTVELIERIYGRIVTQGTLYPTNSITAEIVKTLENAYRDVRIAFSAEVVRWCDDQDVDFFRLRDAVNGRMAQVDTASDDPTTVPTGALLVPTIGVGGHCLPKDGVLLWWRAHAEGIDTSDSLILGARTINDQSPEATIALAERSLGPLGGRRVALLGAAYRFDSEDTRNSPTLALAELLRHRGCTVRIHDPYVYPTDQNLQRRGLAELFTRDLDQALDQAEVVIACVAHTVYQTALPTLLSVPSVRGFIDGCNLVHDRIGTIPDRVVYTGIGQGVAAPSEPLIDFVYRAFQAVERGVANEVAMLIDALNAGYARDRFQRCSLDDVRRLAATCVTGCRIVEPGPIEPIEPFDGFLPSLVERAIQGQAVSSNA